MNHMQRIVEEVTYRELSKLASASDSVFDKVACGLANDGLFNLIQALPPSNINEIRELAGQFLHATLTQDLQEKELKNSPEEYAKKQMDEASSAIRSKLDFMRLQTDLKEAMAKASMETGALPDNPATMAAAQMPGTQLGQNAGQPPAPQGPPPPQAAKPAGPPPLPGSPMEAMGMQQ